MNSRRLLRQLQDRYGVGPAFAAAYWAYWTKPHGRYADRVFTSVDEILALPAPDSVWFDYALSTNQRARALCDLVLSHEQAPVHGRRFLDVGCGFGGLLAAFASRGFEVRGIEIDPARVELARANCADRGLSGVVEQGDILDEALVATLGAFDVIAMVDVIEHVLDPARAIAHVAALLAPGGMLVLEIPNRHSLQFVAADGHFGLFGITLLDRPDACAYQQALFSFSYDVGEYLEFDDYRRLLGARGCDVSRSADGAHPAGSLADVSGLVQAIGAGFEHYLAAHRSKLPPLVDARLQLRFAAFMTALSEDLTRARASAEGEEAFRDRYLRRFWTVLARKA